MRFSAVLALLVIAFVLSGNIYAANSQLNVLAEKAVSGDPQTAANAVNALRSSGPDGLNALIETYAAEINEFRTSGTGTERWQKIAAVIDAVAMQKDAYASGLYWFTDLEQAKKAAGAHNKPILTLRLLGNLNEEFSCANSRLFRSLLYSNTEISRYLRENYVLHWKSVRPAPKLTIDFGDGRKIERTITGNSIHYIIDDDGRIIEALPGLYSPKAFLIYLNQAKQVNDALDGKLASQQDIAVMRYRRLSYERISDKRSLAIATSKINLNSDDSTTVSLLPAWGASFVAATKTIVVDEMSLLRVSDNFYHYEPRIDFSEWQKLADIYSPTPVIDNASTAFIRRQTAKTGLSETEFQKMVGRLRSFVGLDTTRNDLLYHPLLYSQLFSLATEKGTKRPDLEEFNSWVYSEVFKTPDSDKWLGLYSTDVYTALDGNGLVN